jgi:hypothetical protein
MNRTIKEYQKAPRYQCKNKMHRVVKGKVRCTGWSKFWHRAKKGTPLNIFQNGKRLSCRIDELVANLQILTLR